MLKPFKFKALFCFFSISVSLDKIPLLGAITPFSVRFGGFFQKKCIVIDFFIKIVSRMVNICLPYVVG